MRLPQMANLLYFQCFQDQGGRGSKTLGGSLASAPKFLQFDRAEYGERFRVVVEVEVILWVFLIIYHLRSPSEALRALPATIDYTLIAGYAVYLLFNIYCVRTWRFMAWAVPQVAVVDTIGLASIVWHWGGVERLGVSIALLGVMIATLAVGRLYGLWFYAWQTLWLCIIAYVDGTPLFHSWLSGWLIHGLATLTITAIFVHYIRKRERELLQRGEELEEDATVLRRSVERLSRLTQAQVDSLIRSERLATIGQLAPTIVHDLKNPLGALASVAETSKETLGEVLKAGPSPQVEEVAEDLGMIRKQLIRLKDMVQGILNLSRQTEGYLEEVDVNQAAKDALQAVQMQTKAMKVRFDERFGENLPPVLGNQGQISQVLVNLLWNAAQAIGAEEEGIVSLSTALDDGSGYVVLEVSDTGPGIPEDVRPRIFEPFFTTKGASHGTGLGLYLCREIIRRHKGEIAVDRHESGGARFRIRLAAHTPEEEERAAQ